MLLSKDNDDNDNDDDHNDDNNDEDDRNDEDEEKIPKNPYPGVWQCFVSWHQANFMSNVATFLY